jgi:hypothetical protein
VLSSALFVLAAFKLLALKSLSQLLTRRDRLRYKQDLLCFLHSKSQLTAIGIASHTTAAVNVFFNRLGGEVILSPRYVTGCMAAGLSAALISITFTICFLSPHPFHLLSSSTLWSALLLPIFLSAALFAPLDIATAHVLARKSVGGSPRRLAVVACASLLAGYLLWCIGTATVSVLGPLFTGGYFSVSFYLNRVIVALQHPISSVGLLSTASAYVSFHLLSLSMAMVCTLLATFSVSLYVASLLPERGKQLAATPVFAILATLDFFDRRGTDFAIKSVVYGLALLLLAIATMLRLAGA